MPFSSPKKLLSTKEASDLSGYHSDYLARLCREGKLTGERVGRSWLIDASSLELFTLSQESRKRDFAADLATKREREYKRSQAEQFERKHRIRARLSNAIRTTREQGIAMAVAFLVLGFAVTAADAGWMQNSGQFVADSALKLNASLAAAGSTTHVESVAVENSARTRADLLLANAAVEPSRVELNRALTVEFTEAALALAPSDHSFALAAPHVAITAPVFTAPKSISFIDIYRALIASTGDLALNLAAATRDYMAPVPSALGTGALVLASGTVGATHAILDDYSSGVYGFIDVSPKIASGVVEQTYALGDTLGTSVAYMLPATRIAYERGVERSGTELPVFATNATAALGGFANTLTIVHLPEFAIAPVDLDVSGNAAFVADQIDALARPFAFGSHALLSADIQEIHALSGGIGSEVGGSQHTVTDTARIVTNTAHPVLVASAAAPNVTESTALYVYNTIHSFFDAAGRVLAFLFGPHTGPALATNGGSVTLPFGSNSTAKFSSPGALDTGSSFYSGTTTYLKSLRQIINNYTTTQNVQGVSTTLLSHSLGVLSDAVRAEISDALSPLDARITALEKGGGGGGSSATSTDLFGTTLSVTSTSTLQGTLAAGTTTVNGPLTVNGDANITGLLTVGTFAVSNLSANQAIVAPSFIATSTTDVSSFAGPLTFLDATGTSLGVNSLIATSSLFTNLVATNATTTNLYATLFHAVTGTIDTFNATLATITGLTATNATTTNATTTNFAITGNLRLSFATPSRLLFVNSSGIATTTDLSSFVSGTANQITVTDNGTGGVSLSLPSTVRFTNASTSAISANTLAVGGTGTTTISSAGALTTPSLTIGNLSGFLKASAGAVSTSLISLTSDVSGILPVSNGGTGSSSLTGLLKGNGTSAVTTAVAGTDYENPLSFSLPLSRTGNTISIPQSSSSVNGYLSSGDWTTFNGKLGSSTISALTTNSVPLWNGSAFANSVLTQNGTSIGVGTTSPSQTFSVQGNAYFSGKLYVADITATGTITAANLSVGALNGPLQANNGVVSATSSVGVAYGGTGLTTAPTYGMVLVGNSVGGYTLTATSSLGISGGGSSTWGSITGTLSNQTDLQNALDAKLSLSSWYATTTDGLAEGSTHLYWTNNRFDTRLAATTTLPNITTLANLSTISTSLSGIVKATSGVLSTATPGSDYENPLTFVYPITRATNAISLAFGTTTANAWSALQTFTGSASSSQFSSNLAYFGATGTTTVSAAGTLTTPSLVVGSLSGFLKASSGTVSTALISLTSDVSGILPIANGGTGTSTAPTYGQILLGNGSGGYALSATSTLRIALSDTTGVLSQSQGGTGISSYSPGDILYADNSGNLATLPRTSNGQVLKLVGGLPAWGTDLTSGGGGGAGAWATTSDSLAIYPTDTSNVVIVGSAATSTTNSIFEVHGTSYFSNTLGIATTSPSSLFKLAIQGNGLFSGDVTLANIIATGTATIGNIIDNGVTASSLTYANASKQLASVTLPSYITLTSGTLAISALPNAQLQNSTISGVALGSNLFSHTHDATLTGTSYNGSAAVSDWGIDLTHANTWTGLQQFQGNASSTFLSTYSAAYFGATATSSFSSTGALTLATALTVPSGGTGSTTLTGLLKGNGTGQVQTAIAGIDYQAAGNYITALTGDVTASGPGSVAATLATVNGNVGTFGGASTIPTITVNGKGLVTAVTTNTVIAPAGTLTGTTLASNVVSSSLTSVGTLGSLTVSGQTTLANASTTNISGNTLAVGGTGTTSISSTGALTTPSLTVGSLSGLLYGNSGTVSTATINSPLSFTSGVLSIANAIADGSTKGAATFATNDFNDNGSGLISLDYVNGQKASGSQSGFLSSTDWSTFNGKANDPFTHPAAGQSATTSLLMLSGQASTTQLSVYNAAYFGATATSTFTSTGLLGIGTTSPRASLDVASGDAQFGYFAGTPNYLVGISANGNNGLITAVNNTVGDPTSGVSGGAVLGFNGSPTNFYGVGVGTARNSKFDIWFQTGAINGGGYRFYTGTTENLTLTSGGNLGLGTSTPTVYSNLKTFALSGTNGSVIDFQTGSNRIGEIYNDANSFNLYTIGNQYLSFNTNSAEAGRFTSGGSFGLGTTTPVQKLSVQGNAFLSGDISNVANITATGTVTAGNFIDNGVTASTLLYANSSKQEASVTLPSYITLTSGALAISALPNAQLANSTISGVALGGTLANLSATNSTLTFSGAYNGSAAQTVGLNLANANSWSALQQFQSNASSTQLSVYNKAYFGATATSSFDSTGALTLATQLSVANGGTGSTTLSGILAGNGTSQIKTAIIGSGLTWDGSTLSASGSGITAIGPTGQTQTGGTQILATSTSGTDFTITASSNTITFNLPTASASNRGLLSNSDWSTFNSKQAALAFTYPLLNTANTISLDFGTTTANSWSALQQFNGNASTSQLTVTGSTYLATTGGNVGIGLTNPTYKLDVTGTSHFSSYVDAANFIATSTSATSSFFGGFTAGNNTAFTVNRTAPASSIYIAGNGNVGIGTNAPSSKLDVVGSASFETNNATLDVNNLTIENTIAGAAQSFLQFSATNNVFLSADSQLSFTSGASSGDFIKFLGNTTEFARFDSTTGFFGLGTTTPTQKLSVQGNGIISGNLTVANFNATGTATVGNVINNGVTASTLLYANSSKQEASVTLPSYVTLTSGTLAISALPNAQLANSTISGVALGSNLANLSATDGTLTFSAAYNGSTARTVGLNLGNANSWTALQQFQSNASTTQLSVYNRAYFGATATSSFTGTGDLGLGTTTPLWQLSLASTSPSIGLTNTSATNGWSHWAISTQATWGAANSFFTLKNYSDDRTSSTTVFLISGTRGDASFGYGANDAAQSEFGSFNTAIGEYAMGLNQIGGDNTAVGESALYGNWNPNSDVAVGEGAGSGTYYQAKQDTYIGTYAGDNVATSSDNNTLVGFASGYNVTGGYGNTLLGANANFVTNLTTGGNNIGIGYDTLFPDGTANNQLNIGNYIFGTQPATTTAMAAGNLTLPTSGTFGIASTSPWAALSVQANNGSTNTALFAVGSSTNSATSTLFLVKNDGNVGIGTTSPGTLLSVGGSANFTTATSSLYGTGGLNITNGCFAVRGTCVGSGSGGVTSVATDATLTGGPITSTGTLGLNLTNANAWTGLQQFQANASTTQLSVYTKAYFGATATSTFTSTGRLGILNSSPLYALDVSGVINTDQFSGYYQNGSLLGYASSTNGATLFGLQAGGNNATTSATLSGTLAIGYQSLNSLVDGLGNSAVGYQTLTLATSSPGNTALGYQALKGTANGGNDAFSALGQNTAIGYQSLTSIASGTANTAIGYQALQHSTGGVDNTAIGDSALFYADQGATGLFATPGSYNTAIGTAAAFYNTVAEGVVAIGNSAALGSGQYRNKYGVYVGFQSGLFAATSSDYNTFIGDKAGYDVTNGYDNVLIGANPDTGGNHLTTGANNIGIGYNIIFPGGTTASNQLNIGNFIFGTNLTATSSTTSLPGTLKGSLGLGTSSPFAVLDIASSSAATTFKGQLVLTDSNAAQNLKHWLFSSEGGTLYIGTTTDVFATSTPSAFTLLNGGNLGVGTSSPGSLLSVGGSANFTTGTSSLYGTGGLNINAGCFAIRGACVGGGVTNVSTDSTLTGGPITSTGTLGLNLANANIWTGLQQFQGNASSTGISANYAAFGATATSTFTSAGWLGIGTTSPYAQLSIFAGGDYAADAASTLFAIGSSTAGTATSTLFSVSSAGVIDLNPAGFTTPTSTLITIGGEKFLSADNDSFGLNNNEGNLSLGYRALSTLVYKTGGTSPSVGNTAIGTYALYNVQYGDKNTAVGDYALASTTGNGGTLGTNNTGVGYHALISNVSGSSNVALGSLALETATTTNSNTAIGMGALEFNTGSSNTALGALAGRGILQHQTVGDVYIGFGAGNNANVATSSDYNTLVGYQAGADVTSGYDNILIGAEVVSGGSHLTTGANNICIGYNCILPGGTSANNQLNIGNFLFGTSLTATSSSTSLPGTFNGSLGIATSSPFGILDIASSSAATTFKGQLVLTDSNAGTDLKHWLFTSEGGNLYIGTTTDKFATTSPAGIALLNNGDTGFGTSTPWGDLSVLNDGANAGFVVGSAANALQLLVAGNGNVGVGATSTPGTLFSIAGSANFTTASSSLYGSGGLNINDGCFAIRGTCVGGGGGAVSSVSNSDGTLTISPTTGAVVASLALGHANSWSGLQQFTANASSTQESVFNKAYFGATATTTIDSGGNLNVAGIEGIGTTSPFSILDIASSSAATTFKGQLTLTDTNAGTNLKHWLFTSEAGNFYLGTTTDLFATSTPGALTILGGSGSNSGYLGLGTTTPNWNLQVAGTRPSLALTDLQAGSNLKNWLFSSMGGNLYIGTTTDVFATSTPAALTLLGGSGSSSGFLGLGTSTPAWTLSLSGASAALHIKNTASSTAALDVENSYGAHVFSVDTTDTNNPIFSVASSTNTEYLEVGASGNVGLSSTTPWRTLSVVGTVAVNGLTTGAGSGAVCLNNTTKELTYNSGSSACSVSSQRFKTNITNSSPGLAEVLALNPVSYNYKPGFEDNGAHLQRGFIAEQVSAIDPALVVYDDAGLPYTVKYDQVTAVLAKGIQQLAEGYSLANPGAASSTVSSSYAGVGNAAITVDASGKVAIGSGAPNHLLDVNGDIGAQTIVVPATPETFTIGSSSVSVVIPSSVLTASGGADLYKLATYNLAAITQLSTRADLMQTQLDSLDARLTKLENGSVAIDSSSSTTTSSFSTSTLTSALSSLGILVQQGVAQFGTLVTRDLSFSKDADGTSAAGSGTILAGNTVVEIANNHMKATSQVSITLTAPVDGAWYVSQKQDGSFRVALAKPQAQDTTFDYFIVQTNGQIATSTPTGYLTASAASATASADTTAPTITLLGDLTINLAIGGAYNEPGVVVVDGVDGTLPYSVAVNGVPQTTTNIVLDTTQAATYTITYTATDHSGNTATATRTVVVGSGGSSSSGSSTGTTASSTSTLTTNTGTASPPPTTTTDTSTSSASTTSP